MAWAEFAAAWVVFLLAHAVPLRPRVRPVLVRALGAGRFGFVYSALSVGLLGWLITAAGRAPYFELWAWAPWQMRVPQIGMAVAVGLLALTIGRPNPFSFGGARNQDFDPDHPGILRLTRHPILAAMAIRAGAHVVPNGDLAHALMFGGFAIFALIGMRMIDRRRRRQNADLWQAQVARMAAVPVTWFPRPSQGTIVRVIAGAMVYILIVCVHPILFGVEPFPDFDHSTS